jgi:hypothetical protein
MRTLLIGFVLSCSYSFSQNCVDSSLIDPNIMCPDVFMPVCGCDGNTYENACVAQSVGGVIDYTDGPCELDTCMIIPEGVDFGFCAMPLGWISYGGECQMLSGCSMIGSDGNDYSAYFFTSSYECNSLCLEDTTVTIGCVDTSIIDLNVLIPDIYQPVCGCDSITYYNVYQAMYHHGIVSYVEGECPMNGLQTPNETAVKAFPNPFSDHITIQLNGTRQHAIQLVSLDGKTQFTAYSEFKETLQIDTKYLQIGTYILIVEDQELGSRFFSIFTK